jgi:hypothetical protein
MAFLTQLTPAAISQGLTTNYNASAALPANTSTGSALGAIFNSVMALSLQMQGQISYVNGVARLQTSTGVDVDSFVYPFGYTRNPAVASTLTVTFTTPSPAGSQIVITNGTTIQTPSGTQFTVIADAAQPGYSAPNNGYLILVGQSSVNATVQAVIPGSAGNVQANTITQLVSLPGFPVPNGVTGVNNGLAATNGSDKETDAALTARFESGISTRWATPGAILTAIPLAQNGLTFQLGDMLDQYGNNHPNFFSVVVNVLGQNSGPPQAVLNAVNTQVQNNRPCGMPYTVVGPTLVPVALSATLTLQAGASASAVTAAATTAYANYVNYIGLSATGLSTSCLYARVLSILLAVTGVQNVTLLTLNGGTSDITAGFGSQIVTGAITLLTQ